MQPHCEKFLLSGPVVLLFITKIYGETMTKIMSAIGIYTYLQKLLYY